MRLAPIVAILLVAPTSPALASGTTVTGIVYTEAAVEHVSVRLWALGEALVGRPELATTPLATIAAKAGRPFSLDVRDATPPLRVEVAAASHIGATFDILLPGQAALPPLWLPHGREVTVHVTGAPPKVAVSVSGSILNARSREIPPGRWLPALPTADVDAVGSCRVVFPRNSAPGTFVARSADGRWGRPSLGPVEAGGPAIVIDSRRVAVEVRDERGQPVAGVPVAASTAPRGAAVRTDEKGRASIQAPVSGEWAVVALGKGLLARRLVRGSPQGVVALTAHPVAELRVVCSNAPSIALARTSWLPEALGGDVPLTLAGGAGALPFVPPGGMLEVWAPGRAVETLRVTAARPAVAVRLVATATAAGRVVDARGVGVVAVPVWSFSMPGYQTYPRRTAGMWRPEMLLRPQLPATVSGADGRFAVAGLIAGPQRFVAVKAGLPPADSDALEAAPGATLPVTLTLLPGTWVSLVTQDPGGRAISGTEVKVFVVPPSQQGRPPGGPAASGRGDEPVEQGSTDGEGRLHLAPVPVGALALELKAPGFLRRTVEAKVATDGTDLGVEVLEPGIEVPGRVVDGQGHGVPGASVIAEDHPGVPFGEPLARSDAQGQFVIADRPATGELRLLARGEGLVPAATVVVKLPPEAPVELQVRRARALTGRVVDGRDAEPVAGAHVGVGKEITRPGSSMSYSVASVESGEDGSFRAEGLGVGTYTVQVEASGFTRARVDVTVPEGEAPRPVTVVMRPGLAITGRVEDTDSSAAAGVFVDLGPAETGRSQRVSAMIHRSIRSEPDGHFAFDGLEAGRYLVGASDDAAAASAVAEAGAQDELVLHLDRPGSLVCRVEDGDGAAVSGASARLYPAGGVAVSPQTRATDASGEATFSELPPQRYRLYVTAAGLAPATQDATVGAGPPGQVTVVLQRGGVIVGRVVGLTPEQVVRVDVAVRGSRTRPGPDGSFRLEGVAVGGGQVWASLDPEGKEKAVRYDLRDIATPATVEIDFAAGGAVVGTVRRGGRPVAGLTVEAGRAAEMPASTVTAADGGYRIDGIDNGEIDVTLSDDVGRTLASRHVTVDGTVRADFDVPGGELRGSVIDAESRDGVASVTVNVRGGIAPAVERTVETSETGAFTVAELADGDYTVRATAAGYAPDETTAHLTMGQSPDVTLPLAPEQRLELTAIETDGSAADQVMLAPIRGGRVEDQVWARCDATGKAVVTSLAPGEYGALILGRGAALTRLRVPSRGNQVRLAPSGRLQVVTPSSPAAAWRVRVSAGGAVIPVLPWLNPDRGEWAPSYGLPLVVRVPAGAYAVEARDPAGAVHAVSAVVLPDGDVTVRPGE